MTFSQRYFLGVNKMKKCMFGKNMPAPKLPYYSYTDKTLVYTTVSGNGGTMWVSTIPDSPPHY